MPHPSDWIRNIIDWFKGFRGDDEGALEGGGSAFDRREHVRFEYHYSVTVLSGMKKFETSCKDISLGGMKLKHPLPPSMLGQQCRVSISDNKHRDSIVIQAKVISDTSAPRRISFSDTDAESHAKLKEWLRARYVTQIKNG